MNREYFNLDGTPADTSKRCQVDHTVDEINLVIRSSQGIPVEFLKQIRDFVQRKHEVTHISVEKRKLYVKPC